MASHRIFTPDSRGFSLVEILVVIGLFAIVASFGLFMSMETYRSTMFKNDRDVVINALTRARSQAINNMCFGTACTDGESHGVHIGADAYTVFQGTTYATRDTAADEVIERSDGITIVGPSEIVFTKLSGQVSSPGVVTVTNESNLTTAIDINAEGRIAWSF